MTETKRDANASLASEPIGRLLLKFSVPCVLSMLVSAPITSWTRSLSGRASVTLETRRQMLSIPSPWPPGPGSLAGDGSAAKLSLTLGSGDQETSHKCIGNGILATVFIGIVMTAAGFLFSDQILRLFGVTEASYPYAREYMEVILIGIPFYIFASGMNAAIRGRRLPRLFHVQHGHRSRAEPDSGSGRHLRIPHGGTGRGHRHSHRPGGFLLRHHPVFPETEILSLLKTSFLPDWRLLGQIGQLESPALSHRSLLSSL